MEGGGGSRPSRAVGTRRPAPEGRSSPASSNATPPHARPVPFSQLLSASRVQRSQRVPGHLLRLDGVASGCFKLIDLHSLLTSSGPPTGSRKRNLLRVVVSNLAAEVGSEPVKSLKRESVNPAGELESQRLPSSNAEWGNEGWSFRLRRLRPGWPRNVSALAMDTREGEPYQALSPLGEALKPSPLGVIFDFSSLHRRSAQRGGISKFPFSIRYRTTVCTFISSVWIPRRCVSQMSVTFTRAGLRSVPRGRPSAEIPHHIKTG